MPRIAVIGAGPSGLAALKKLQDAGFDPVAFEQNAEVGGNWLFSEQPCHSSVYAGTHIISSKAFSQYADYAMPAHYPDYPSRTLLLEYFQGYARAFRLHDRVAFRTTVARCEPGPEGGWQLTLRGPGGTRVEAFDHVLVANGHHWDPRWPAIPGTFSGRYLHSHDFKTARGFEALRVLVIGGGNSACDCACEVSRLAARTALSLRRGYWFMPKFLFGLPNDAVYARLLFLPPRLRQALVGLLLRVVLGPFERYGLPQPDHRVLESHPTLNSELLDRLRHGDVVTRPDVARFDGARVVFQDGRAEEYDAVIACTGFRNSFPFLDRGLVDFSGGAVPLYLRVFHPDLPGLYFIGLVQPLGCIWPLAELQAELVAARIAGRFRLPADLRERALEELRNPPFRFLPTPRHALEVDYHLYSRQLRRALRRRAA
jgi:cation diffusion facilitator CzcD-associated flavoprotein CzcO